jgi:molybdate transport system permease protein
LLFGEQIAFSFKGLLLASCILNAPLIIQPIHRAFENIPRNLRDAGLVSGLMPWQIFWKIEIPLVWTGLVSGVILSFVHTLGEFGVVLMIGGSIPGETKTIAISIYDKVQAFDLNAANQMSLTLLTISTFAVIVSFFISNGLEKK